MNDKNVSAQCLLQFIASGMCLLAPASWPYGYYRLLRIVVCIAGAYTSYRATDEGRIGWAWVFGFIAVLFNPIVPVYLTKGAWTPIDLIVGGLFFVYAIIQNSRKGQ